MAGIGGCVGYTIGAINWNQTFLSFIFSDNIKTGKLISNLALKIKLAKFIPVFALVTLIFIICMICTLTSFREIPLRLLESDEMLRPLNQVAVKKEKERLKALESSKQPTTSTFFVTETENNNPTPNGKLNGISYIVAKDNINHHINMSNGSISSSDDDEDEPEDTTHVSFMTYIKSIIFMPRALRILCITNCFAWMGQIVYSLYFTDFVGESVFMGDPSADPTSQEYIVRTFNKN
jgi:solute carrier family 45, member 1/2/4